MKNVNLNGWLQATASAMLLIGSTWSGLLSAQENLLNDSDGDRIVDTIDVDDDNDGIPDVLEISTTGLDIDSDNDGMPNRLDLDSDNDGILDWKESGAVVSVDFSQFRVVSGRILGPVGTNGFIDALEVSLDNGQIRYTLINSDSNEDDLPDVLDLDSDNDGLPDLVEAGVADSLDSNNDGRIDTGDSFGGVGSDGIPDRLQSINDSTCCDVTADGIEDAVPRNSDNSDLPDFQDLDSDNDGVFDIVEAGGSDFNDDGRVDNFFDSPVIDGMDDAILLIPFELPDTNGNALADVIDQFAQAGSGGSTEQPSNVPQITGTDSTDAGSTDADSTDTGSTANGVEVNNTGVGSVETVDRNPVPRPGDNIMLGSDLPLSDDPDAGTIQTGLNAAGCSVQSNGMDLMLLILAVLSMAFLGRRYSLRRRRH